MNGPVHLEARGFFDRLRLPGGAEGRSPGTPYVLSDGVVKQARIVPALGEHNAAIFGELLGRRADELAIATAEGAI